MEYLELYWRKERIGSLRGPQIDMGFVEGLWEPASTDLAREFMARVSQFDVRVVNSDPLQGTRIQWAEQGIVPPSSHGLVLGLDSGKLIFRMVTSPAAIAHLLAHVPE